MPPVGAALWRSLRAHQVYGANTDVGKTIVSTVLCNAIQRQNQQAAFLKPVSTGALDDADDRYVFQIGIEIQLVTFSGICDAMVRARSPSVSTNSMTQ
jgi:hypothetical protein